MKIKNQFNTLAADMSYPKPSRQSGVTLIELMVSLTLGIILTLGIMEIYSATKMTHNFNMELARLQEDHRFLLNYLENNIRLAGWRVDPRVERNSAFLEIKNYTRELNDNTVTVSMQGGQAIAGVKINDWDAIVIRRQANADPLNEAMTNCLGQQDDPAANQIINIFYIAQTKEGSSLQCFPDDGVTKNPRSQPVVLNVTGMAVRYGVALPTGDFQYFNVATMDKNAALWRNVVSVQLELLLQSAQPLASAPQPYTFPSWAASQTVPDNKFLRKVVSTTIRIRN